MLCAPGLGKPDLFLTGAFYKGFTVNVTPIVFEVDSTDFKSSSLIDQYGEKIFGLTKDNMKVYASGVLSDNIHKYVTLKTGLPFK